MTNNPSPDAAQRRRERIAEQHPDAPGVARRKESFLESVVSNYPAQPGSDTDQRLPDRNGSFWLVAQAITGTQIEAARKAEQNSEARRSKWADQLHDRNPHE